MNRLTKTLITVIGTAALGLSAAHAGEVQLFHDKGFWSAQLQEMGAKSEEMTGVKIAESPYSSAEQYKAFIQSSIAGGEAPEMFTWWTGETFNELVGTGKIAPLTDVWDAMVARGDFGAGAADLFKVDGEVYGIPMLVARWVVLYNKDIFAEVGISEPANWEEFMANAAALKAAGHTPFVASVQDGWRGFIWFQELMLRSDPVAFAGLHDGSVAYDSDAVRNAFQIWSDLYGMGYFSDPRSNEEAADFASGKGAMNLIGEWTVGIAVEAGLAEDKIGAFIMPNMDPSLSAAVIVEGAPIVVSTEGKGNADVMTAVNFWVSVDGANAWGSASGNYIGNVNANAPNSVISKISGDMTTAGTGSVLRWWEAVAPDLQGELVAEMNRFMLEPTMEVAEEVMATMQALNADYWASK